MKYYKEKKRAINMVDNMFDEGKSDDEIYFKVSKKFGFSEKFVKNRTTFLTKFLLEDKNNKKEVQEEVKNASPTD